MARFSDRLTIATIAPAADRETERLEVEADTAAKDVGIRAADAKRTLDPIEFGDAKSSPSGTGSGSPLDSRVRMTMESHFGHDFGRVRVHDTAAATALPIAGAHAATLGTHIVFGAGRYAPASADGRQLLAHELAHVIQQRSRSRTLPSGQTLSPAPPAAQHKLVLTGSGAHLARVLEVMNAGLGPEWEAVLTGAREVEIKRTGAMGPPTPASQHFQTRLSAIVSEAGTTTVAVGAGGVPIVGSYALSQIDIADIQALGIGQRGWDARAALLHELVEQREKQVGATAAQRAYGSDTTGAHSVGLAAELGMIGAALESDSGLVGATANSDGTMDGSRTVVFRYPDGSRYRVEVTLTHNNITNVQRAKLP